MEYLDDIQPMKVLRPIKLMEDPTICRYEWRIDPDIFNSFVNAYNGQSFWPTDNFGPNGMFGLYCCPNGCMASDTVYFSLALPYSFSKLQTIADK